MRKYTLIIVDSGRNSRQTLCLNSLLIYTLLSFMGLVLIFSLYLTKVQDRIQIDNQRFLKVLSQNQLVKTKLQLAYNFTDRLNNRIMEQNKNIDRLNTLTSREKENFNLLNENFRQVVLDKEVLGSRIVSYKIKIGNRTLFQYFADNDKRIQKLEIEQKVADIKINLQEIINNNDFNKQISIINISDDEYIGLIDSLMVFYANKQEAEKNHISELELAEKYKDILNKELKIAKNNSTALGNPILRKVILTKNLNSTSEIANLIQRKQSFIARAVKDDTVRISDVYGKAVEIQANYAKTPSVYPMRYSFITSPFGYRTHPVTRRHLLHTGLDIAAFSGTRVLSTADGVVSFVGWENGYGNVVEVNHGFGLSTLYAHCSALLVRRGQRVKKNQTIALSGSTGLVEGPHLHYEVKKLGKCVDPAPYLNRDILTAKKDW